MEEPDHAQSLPIVRGRHVYFTREEKAVRPILDESGPLSALQVAEDLSYHSKDPQ
jgi:hypothetical protein